jgi:hypothetical protein
MSVDEEPDTAECGAGCGCDTSSGLSTKGKVIVCLVIGLAAAAVLAGGIIKNRAVEDDGVQESFATALAVALAEAPASPVPNAAELAAKEKTGASLWGAPLDSLATLNTVAAEKNAVFVLLPAEDDAEVEKIKRQIEAAATKITARGTTMAAFILEKTAKDYAQITKQASAPCVLTLVKGGGMSVVSNDITEASLLQALVSASRPSGCGPAAGPSCCP